MKEPSLLRFTALTVFGAAVLLNACSSDSDGSSGMSSGGASGGAAAGNGGEATAGASEGGTAGEESAGGAIGEGGTNEAGGAAGSGGNRRFTVTLENVAPTKLFTSAGVFDTPVGDTSPGPATPGKMYQFTIDAGRKQKLSFATMLAATNDLFFAPDGAGIALYDSTGAPISGDVTSQVRLWDAGT